MHTWIYIRIKLPRSAICVMILLIAFNSTRTRGLVHSMGSTDDSDRVRHVRHEHNIAFRLQPQPMRCARPLAEWWSVVRFAPLGDVMQGVDEWNGLSTGVIAATLNVTSVRRTFTLTKWSDGRSVGEGGGARDETMNSRNWPDYTCHGERRFRLMRTDGLLLTIIINVDFDDWLFDLLTLVDTIYLKQMIYNKRFRLKVTQNLVLRIVHVFVRINYEWSEWRNGVVFSRSSCDNTSSQQTYQNNKHTFSPLYHSKLCATFLVYFIINFTDVDGGFAEITVGFSYLVCVSTDAIRDENIFRDPRDLWPIWHLKTCFRSKL